MSAPPVFPGFYPDPSICRSGNDYFVVNSSFEYFPGVPIFHSRDLCTWRQIGHVLDRPEQLDLTGAWISGGVYAPTLREHEGIFYMITTLMGIEGKSGNFLVKSTDPFGDWSDPVWIPEAKGIDPDLFWEDDETCYLQWSWKEKDQQDICIGQARIDVETGSLLEAPRVLWSGTGGLGPEGPHLYKVNGCYYLCIAEGGTEYGHMQTLARASSPQGPWESCPFNPVLTHRSLGSPVQAVGHADWVQTPSGDWYGVAHGIRPKGYHKFHVLGRETFLFPIRWQDDGWPVLGEEGRLPENTITVEGQSVCPQSCEFSDDFNESIPPLDWNYLRTQNLEVYQRSGNGHLVLTGCADTLDHNGQPTWTGVRQRNHHCEIGATCSIMVREDQAEAGITVFQNLHHHACIGLKLNDGIPTLFTRIRLGSIIQEDDYPDIAVAESTTFHISARDLTYHLGIMGKDEEFHSLTDCEARFLSTEFGGRFTGVYFALYAQGNAVLDCTEFDVRAVASRKEAALS